MIDLEIQLAGFEELDDSFAELEEALDKGTERLLKQSAAIVQRRARGMAPRSASFRGFGAQKVSERTRGPLRDAIKSTGVFHDIAEGAGGGMRIRIEEDASTKTGWKGMHYGMLVEKGTTTHAILPKSSNKHGLLFFDPEVGSRLARSRKKTFSKSDTAKVLGTALFKGGKAARKRARKLGTKGPLTLDPGPGRGGRRTAVFLKRRGKRSKAKAKAGLVSLPGSPANPFVAKNRRGKGSITSTKSNATLVATPIVLHPGTTANPFFERAIRASLPEIELRAQHFADRIERAWERA